MPDEPQSDEPQSAEPPRDRRSWLRAIAAVFVGFLFVGEVALYSLHKALRSRVEAQDHRVERLQEMVADMIKANQNAEKIEKIETQVDSIGVQVTDLTTTIKAQNAEAEEKTSKRRRGRRQR